MKFLLTFSVFFFLANFGHLIETKMREKYVDIPTNDPGFISTLNALIPEITKELNSNADVQLGKIVRAQKSQGPLSKYIGNFYCDMIMCLRGGSSKNLKVSKVPANDECTITNICESYFEKDKQGSVKLDNLNCTDVDN